MVERVRTGIEGLDQMLHGGFLRGDAVMVGGSAGTGKTTLALQYLVNGIKSYGENGIYVTFEELPDQLYRDAMNFGWDLRKLDSEDKLRVVCTSPELLLEPGGMEFVLDGFIDEIKARRIVVDSLSHVQMYAHGNDLRKDLYRLIMYLKTRRLSSLLLWEAQAMGQTSEVTDSGTSFLVDSILMLKLVEMDSSMKKALVMLKLRGSDHDKQLREYEIANDGIRVSAPFVGYDSIMTGSAKRSLSEAAIDSWANAFQTAKPKDRK